VLIQCTHKIELVKQQSRPSLLFTVHCGGLQVVLTSTFACLLESVKHHFSPVYTKVASFFACVHKGIEAVLDCTELGYKLPTTEHEIQQSANNFKVHSTNGVIDGCVGCVDGLLLRIQTPSAREVGNVKAFFSGHYRAYGVNVQAMCDSQCRFIYACVAAPGGTNDIAAYRKTSLTHFVENLPIGKYMIGDNAYICTEHLLTPFRSRRVCNILYNNLENNSTVWDEGWIFL
jgi:DDE superfamily endonuclease